MYNSVTAIHENPRAKIEESQMTAGVAPATTHFTSKLSDAVGPSEGNRISLPALAQIRSSAHNNQSQTRNTQSELNHFLSQDVSLSHQLSKISAIK